MERKKEKNRTQRLTTGPDLPVKPIGPGGPRMASCRHRHTDDTFLLLEKNILCLLFTENVYQVLFSTFTENLVVLFA